LEEKKYALKECTQKWVLSGLKAVIKFSLLPYFGAMSSKAHSPNSSPKTESRFQIMPHVTNRIRHRIGQQNHSNGLNCIEKMAMNHITQVYWFSISQQSRERTMEIHPCSYVSVAVKAAMMITTALTRQLT
jgi:hypothetical protein